MNAQHPNTIQQITGRVLLMFYLVDESTTALTIQIDGQIIAVRAYGQLALDLRALPRGATICATLYDVPDGHQIIAFALRFS
jgi:hypothetical protein